MKMWYIHMMKYYLAIREVKDTSYKWLEPWKHALWQHPDTKNDILFDSIYVKYPEQASL